MISLYTDEDVDILIKPLLNAKGYRVFTTHDEGMLGKNSQTCLLTLLFLKQTRT